MRVPQSGRISHTLRAAAFLFAPVLIVATSKAPPTAAGTIKANYSAGQNAGSDWGDAYTQSGSLSSAYVANVTPAVSGFARSVEADITSPATGEYGVLANTKASAFLAMGFLTVLLASAKFRNWSRLGVSSAHVIALAATLMIGQPSLMQAQGPPTGGMPPGGGTPPGGGSGPGLGGMGPGGGAATTAVSGMTIGPYQLLNSYQASLYQYYYTFTTSVSNANSAPYTYVLGTLASSNANTVVVSGSVEFGLVPASGTATGLDSFTILQDRRYAFDPTSLTWTFTGATSSSTIGTTISNVTLSVSSVSIGYGAGVNLIATVFPAAGTGTVTFYDGPLPIETATVASGTALLSSVILPTGNHNISALYSGDNTYASSSSSQDTIAVGTGGAAASCSGTEGITPLVVCLAAAFESTLTGSQVSTLQLDYTLANAGAWTNLPGRRNGLQLGTLSSTQLAAALQLAQAALSPQGYARLYSIIGANNILGEYTSGYGSAAYYIAFLGTPSTTSPWQLQIGGHHLAFNHTFNGQYRSGTPYFIGNEPEIFNVAGTLYLPTQGPHDAAYALTRSVYGNSTALLSGTFDDVVMGSSGQDAYPHTYPSTGRGIPYTALTAAQQAQVRAMIEAWVTDMDITTSSSSLNVYEDPTALANTYVGYSGTGTLTTQGDYIRVDGPRVWIEFCVQNGIVFNQSFHFHTIWRDKTADYGGDFLSN